MKPYYRILRLNHGRAPTVQHATLKDAETEALRLAGQHPGETFEILKVLGLARTTEPSIFWNDGVEPPAPEGPGDGYRWLVVGDVIEAGDQYRLADDWGTFDPAVYGWPYGMPAGGRAIYGPCRRKLPAPEHYPTTPLPEGFDRWVCRGEAWSSSEYAYYVTYWPDRDSWDETPTRAARPAGVSGLEYWEAVKDEPSYRMLELGEQVLPGDEFRNYRGEWVPTICGASDPFVITDTYAGRYRRPVQAYRMLEPGERIEEGDELVLADGTTYPRTISIGDVFRPDHTPTRRKIPKP